MDTQPTLYRRVRLAGAGDVSAVLVSGGQVAWTGPDTAASVADPPPGTAVIDLDGQLMLPAFVDAHVHVTETGLWLDGLQLATVRSAAELLALVAHAATSRPGEPVIGHGWDELNLAGHRLPSMHELDRAAGGGDVYLSRIDVHSALVSSALAARTGITTLDGWDPSGRVERDAHHAARHATRFEIAPDRRRHLQRLALAAAAAAGIAEVHECSGPHVAPEQDLRDLLALAGAEPLPRVLAYWGELATSARHALQIRDRVLGPAGDRLRGLAGDLMVDGSIGSRTAAVQDAYADAATRGHLYLDQDQIATHVMACTQAGLQAGFHVIGDRATGTVLAGLRRAAAELGPEGAELLRAGGHRLEHVESISVQDLATLTDFGMLASVQPAFDAAWGGPAGMYAHRLGSTRALALNPFAAMHAAGVGLAFGSDSPVTPFAPWDGVRAAAQHHVPGQRLPPHVALAAHLGTPGEPAIPVVRVGAPADLAVWAASSLDAVFAGLLPDGAGPDCVLTIAGGQIVHRR